MINSYINTSKTVAANTAIPFDNNSVYTNCLITHDEGSSSFKINKPGYYMVVFNGDATNATGNVQVELFYNNTQVAGAEASATAGALTDIINLKFSTIIKVLPNCPMSGVFQNLNFINSGVEATFTNANVIIKKIC